MLGDPASPFARNAAGPMGEQQEVAGMGSRRSRARGLERWLRGMRRLQVKIEAEGGRDG